MGSLIPLMEASVAIAMLSTIIPMVPKMIHNYSDKARRNVRAGAVNISRRRSSKAGVATADVAHELQPLPVTWKDEIVEHSITDRTPSEIFPANMQQILTADAISSRSWNSTMPMLPRGSSVVSSRPYDEQSLSSEIAAPVSAHGPDASSFVTEQ